MHDTHCPTLTMTLGDLIDRLAAHPTVHGLVVIGSGRDGTPPPYSDYDLVIALDNPRLPLHVGMTWVDGRFTDLIFVTTKQVQHILDASDPLEPATPHGRLLEWLAHGRIAFDRHGQLGQVQNKVQDGAWLRRPDVTDMTHAWNSLNYNVTQTHRLLTVDDPLYLLAAEVRMAWFGTGDLLAHYRTIRGLPQTGEKEMLRHLQEHDPDYLARLQQFLHAPNRKAKFDLYVELASAAAAPLGGLWPDHTTAFQVDRVRGEQPGQAAAQLFWHDLIGLSK